MHRLICFGLVGLGVALGPTPAATAQSLRTAGPPVPLVADGTAAVMPHWSPDGTRLAFTRAGYHGLWVVEADGGSARQLTDWAAAGFGFSWSPDGGALLARPALFDGPRRLNAVAVIDVATGEASLLTDWRPRMPTLPQWTAADRVVLDGRPTPEAFALDRAPSTMRADGSTGQLAVFVREAGLAVASPESAPRLIAEGAVLNPAVSPDGSLIAYEEMGGGLVVVRADGTGRVDLGAGHRPAWSPDGRWIVFMTTEDDGHVYTAADLVAARPDGSARVRLTDTPGRLEMNPSWSPDGGRIAYDDPSDGALYVLPVTE